MKLSRRSLQHLERAENFRFLLTDIDDTITDDGELKPKPYEALWKLAENNLKVIPVTGRPAGWCEMIARFWPVDGVIGENGAFYFRYDRSKKKMLRRFFSGSHSTVVSSVAAVQSESYARLGGIKHEVLTSVPGCQVASDQFARLTDLAIDFAEDVPHLSTEEVLKIKSIFEKHGATAKVSSIHVNGWFGQYDKVSTAMAYLREEHGLNDKEIQENVAFVGDSPNDEPMFAKIANSFGVANVEDFEDQIQHWPRYVATLRGGQGFCEIVAAVLAAQSRAEG